MAQVPGSRQWRREPGAQPSWLPKRFLTAQAGQADAQAPPLCVAWRALAPEDRKEFAPRGRCGRVVLVSEPFWLLWGVLVRGL